MDYKNKYNEVLARAITAYKDGDKHVKDIIETIFPEIKETEDDNIRKKYEKWVAWVEKQGKNNMGISETTKQKLEDMLNKTLEKETTESWNEYLDKQCKQNDSNLIEILKHYPRETELYSPLYGKLWLAEVDEENEIITCYRYPLNKGCKRAILEQESTISFYSNGTTGLPDCTISKNCMLFLYNKNQSEQKPVEWSEEDEEIVEALNDYTKNLDIFFSEIKIGDKDILSKEFREKVQHWLKSLKGRVQPHSKQEWGEEDFDYVMYI